MIDSDAYEDAGIGDASLYAEDREEAAAVVGPLFGFDIDTKGLPLSNDYYFNYRKVDLLPRRSWQICSPRD